MLLIAGNIFPKLVIIIFQRKIQTKTICVSTIGKYISTGKKISDYKNICTLTSGKYVSTTEECSFHLSKYTENRFYWKKFVIPPVRNVFPLLVAINFTFSTGRKYVSTTGSNYFYVQKYVFLVFLHYW